MVRAARHGFSLMLAIIGGSPTRFAEFSALYARALEHFGREPLPVGIHIPGHVAATDQAAYDLFLPRYRDMFGKRAIERGYAPADPGVVPPREIGPAGCPLSARRRRSPPKIASIMTAPRRQPVRPQVRHGALSHSLP